MFWMVNRIFNTKEKNSHSVEYFYEKDYESRDDMIRAAKTRYYNIVAADLQKADVVYQATFIMDEKGNVIERPIVFNRQEG